MLDLNKPRTSVAQLAGLLGELLDMDGAKGAGEFLTGDIPSEVIELRDMARRLRAASQSVPLPEGRLAVRRALLATARRSRLEVIQARAAWRRTGRWLGMVAMVGMIVGAFGLGAGLLNFHGSRPSHLNVWRSGGNGARLASAPGRTQRTTSSSRSGQAGTLEMGEFAGTGYVLPASISGYPLTYLFAGVTIPSAPGDEVTVQGTVGGLPVTLSLTATKGCSTGTDCGLFEVWVTPFRGTLASAEFGQIRGTFICAVDTCTLTPVSKSGVFNTISSSVLQVNASGQVAGLAGTGFASLGEWVAGVEQVAVRLKSEGLLPTGVTVADLVSEAATNQTRPKPSPEGRIDGAVTSGVADSRATRSEKAADRSEGTANASNSSPSGGRAADGNARGKASLSSGSAGNPVAESKGGANGGGAANGNAGGKPSPSSGSAGSAVAESEGGANGGRAANGNAGGKASPSSGSAGSAVPENEGGASGGGAANGNAERKASPSSGSSSGNAGGNNGTSTGKVNGSSI